MRDSQVIRPGKRGPIPRGTDMRNIAVCVTRSERVILADCMKAYGYTNTAAFIRYLILNAWYRAGLGLFDGFKTGGHDDTM